jgi:hypothetical protein
MGMGKNKRQKLNRRLATKGAKANSISLLMSFGACVAS